MTCVSDAVRRTKRALDLFAAALGLATTLPLYPAIAAAIWLDSPGPLFYRQRRAGRLLYRPPDPAEPFVFEEFEMLKFRTMCADAESRSGAVLAEVGDARVTRVGRLLRRFRIDELPQFWNVLRGEMSLVGPRPERPELLANLALAIPFFEERLREVKPGITGLAQVHLGYAGQPPPESPVAELKDGLVNPFRLAEAEGADADHMRLKLLYDLAYAAALERFSTYLRTELEVILKTPLVMVLGRGY